MRLALLLLSTTSAIAATNGTEMPLWPNRAPGSEAFASVKEVVDPPHPGQEYTRVWGIHHPSLLVYLPPAGKATGAAMIVAPGGGHQFLSLDMEGTNVAEWLNSVGVAAFVLKYRLAREKGSTYQVDVHALADARRAIRTVRARAAEWNVNPSKIGILGFSAGGELAALASTRFEPANPSAADPLDRPSSRPDYQVLIYPGIRPGAITIAKDTPPAFLLCADNDRGPSNAVIDLYRQMKSEGVPAEVHVFLTGGHGFGLRKHEKQDVVYTTWVLRLQDWMAAVGMSPPK